MKKFSRIVEGSDNMSSLLSKINVTKDDLMEILVDLSDVGYTIDLEEVYVSTKDGYPHRKQSSTKDFYPGIEIGVYRKTTDDEGGILSNYNDVRKWNGGVYYENDISIIESITSIVYRLQSTFGDKSKVYYSLRSINDISIRILFDASSNDEPVDYDSFKKYLDDLETRRIDSNISELEDESIEYYNIFRTISSGNIYKTEIRPNKNIVSKPLNITTPTNSSDFIIKSIIEDGENDNKYQLDKIFDIYVKKLFKHANNSNRVELVKSEGRKGTTAYNIINKESKKVIFNITSTYEDFATFRLVQKGGLLKRDKVTRVDIYYMDIRIEIVE
jgi:hypothetical protein